MTIGEYLLRAGKYFLKLAVLLGVIFVVMHRSGTSNLAVEGGIGSFFEAFFASVRGRVFLVAIVVWCVVYPAVEFKRRRVAFALRSHKDVVIKALNANRMTLVQQTEGQMIFHGSLARRIWWLGEETVAVTDDGTGGFEIEGPRQAVFDTERRFLAMVDNDSEKDA